MRSPRPNLIRARIVRATRLVHLAEAAVRRRAGRQPKLAAVHGQIDFRIRIIERIDDGDGLTDAPASQAEIVGGAQVRGRVSGWPALRQRLTGVVDEDPRMAARRGRWPAGADFRVRQAQRESVAIPTRVTRCPGGGDRDRVDRPLRGAGGQRGQRGNTQEGPAVNGHMCSPALGDPAQTAEWSGCSRLVAGARVRASLRRPTL